MTKTLEQEMMEYAYKGNIRRVLDCLSQGANIHYQDKDGRSLIYCFAYLGKRLPVKVLLDRGANPNFKTVLGVTPLMSTVVHGDVEIVELLLRRKAETHHRNINGEDVFILARLAGNKRTLALLQQTY